MATQWTFASWSAAVTALGGLVTVWPFAGFQAGAPAARYSTELASPPFIDPLGNGSTTQPAPNGSYFYVLAPLFVGLGAALSGAVTQLEGVAAAVATGAPIPTYNLPVLNTNPAAQLATEASDAGVAVADATVGTAMSAVADAAAGAKNAGALGLAAAVLGVPEWALIIVLLLALYLLAIGAGLVPPPRKLFKK